MTYVNPENGLSPISFNLTEFAKEFLREEFDMDLNIPIKINGRLTTSYGRFSTLGGYAPARIELSKKLLWYESERRIKDVLKHELVHYALFVKGKPHKDGDRYFENTLDRLGVGATRTIVSSAPMHQYSCPTCSDSVQRPTKLRDGYTYICSGHDGDRHERTSMIYEGKEELPWREVDFKKVI